MENLARALNWHWSHLLIIPGVMVAYTVYELGYSLMAYYLGDNSQVERGHIHLNPFQHLSWLGSLTFILTGFIGFPKPLRFDPRFFKDRNLDTLLVAIAGPVANLSVSLLGFLVTLAAAFLLAIGSRTASWSDILSFFLMDRAEPPVALNFQAWVQAFTGQVWLANFTLAMVSLLPLPATPGYLALKSLLGYLRAKQAEPKVERVKPTPTGPLPDAAQAAHRNAAATIHFEKGVEYHGRGEFDDAIARYRQALRADKHFGPAYINLGRAYLGKGQRREAIQAFRGATQLANDDKSKAQAWSHLHHLSEVSPIDRAAEQQALSEQGAAPWTDTRPSPDWLALGASAALIVAFLACLYGYLLITLVSQLR